MTSPRWLVGRQPVLDRVGRVWGYELLFRSADGTGLPGDASFATANVLLGTVAGIGTREVLGGKPALVNVGQELLFSDALELLPRNLIVLEVLESVTPSRSVVQRCRALKAAGFSIALDDQLYDAAWDDLYALADLGKVDVMAGDEVTVASAVERLRRFPAALLAEKVETPDAYRRCLDLGFHYFQGYHFARPAVVGRRKLGEDGTLLLDLLRRLNAGAEVPELEETFRRSPGLTFKLLVLVNSVSVGVRERIGSIRQAITMLGRDQLRRWLQLALFATDEQRGLDDPLVELAAVRAALMEKLATGLAWPAVEGEPRELAWMAGVLSLLDTIFELSMADVVRDLRLAQPVALALLERAGPLGQLLLAAEAFERQDADAGLALTRTLGFEDASVLAAQQEAFAWRGAGAG